MLAPRIARANTTEAASSSSELSNQRQNLSGTAVAVNTANQVQALQRRIGNQATMRLLAQRADDRWLALSPAEQLLMLQRAVGNQATIRLLAQRAKTVTANKPGSQGSASGRLWDFSKIPDVPPGHPSRPAEGSPFTTLPLPGVIQPKLEVGAVDDPLEREADRVADMVMQVPDHGKPQVARNERDTEPMLSILGGQEKTAGRKGMEDEDEPLKKTTAAEKCSCREDNERIQKTAEVPRGGGLDADDQTLIPEIETRIKAMRGEGRVLNSFERAFMEPRFGADFSAIRIHTNQEADAHSRTLHARAFTVGSDIFFRAGEYTPGNAEGHRLLAHELTHTIQQGAASPLGDQHLDARSTARLVQRQPPPVPPPPAPAAAAAPAGRATVNFLPVLMDQAPAGWGVTTEDDVVIDITAFASGATWKCVITTADQQAHQGVRLLPGVVEVTPALVAGRRIVPNYRR
jgi:hypothetical protein